MTQTDKFFYSCLFFCLLILLILAFYTDGMAGGGDAINHFMFAKFSWKHHELFFDHWAKPVFTILSSPFAQLGYKWVKVFNVLIAVTAAYFTFRSAKILSIRNAFLVAFFYFGSTLNVTVTLSALTEPLFALVLILSIYYYLKKQPIAATIIISFLPFVRSEGLIMLCIFVVYLLLTKRMKLIPLLLTGHFIMSIAGYFYYHDVLWVFNKIPYAKNYHNYGSGTWDHFIITMEFMIGPVLYSLLIIGGLAFVFLIKKKFSEQFFFEKLILVYGVFVGFFFAHSAFWALGIFNSLGLGRVFVGVMPLLILIAIEGLNTILQFFGKESTKKIVLAVLTSLVIIFPFFKNPAGYNFERDFDYTNGRLMQHQIIPYLQTKFPSYKIYSSVIDFPFFMDIDFKDDKKYASLSSLNPDFSLKENEVIIWDNWFSVVEEHITEEALKSQLRADTFFQCSNGNSDTTRYVVFIKRPGSLTR